MCELMIGLPAINVLGLDDERDGSVVVHVESCARRPGCPCCDTPAWVKDRPAVELVDRRGGGLWRRAHHAGAGRIGEVSALGLDETLFCRTGRWRTQQWCTSIVDVSPSHTQLLDVVAGRSAAGPSAWLDERAEDWRPRSASACWICRARTARPSTTPPARDAGRGSVPRCFVPRVWLREPNRRAVGSGRAAPGGDPGEVGAAGRHVDQACGREQLRGLGLRPPPQVVDA